ncbi:MAG: hypothetical protein QXO51_05995 [Halobacteria archaeon]
MKGLLDLPALRYLWRGRDAFREVRPPAGWARLEPLGWVVLFLGVHTSLFYSQLLSIPHFGPAAVGALAVLLLQAGVFWVALRLAGAKVALGESLWAAPLTWLPVVVFFLVAYVPIQLLSPDLFYDYFFDERVRYLHGVAVIIIVLAMVSHTSRLIAEEMYRLSPRRSMAVGTAVALLYVFFGLALYAFVTSADLLYII